MSRGVKPTTHRSPTRGGRELRARVSAGEYARVEAAAAAVQMTVPAYVRSRVLGARYQDHLPAVMAATEPVELGRPLPVDIPPRFGGRRPGGSCGCGGVFEQIRHENPSGWTLDCATCHASYDEDGNSWCPTCETWPKRWVGGTDADPRPACENCGADQPGWPARPLVMAKVDAVEERSCWTCRYDHLDPAQAFHFCCYAPIENVLDYMVDSGAEASRDGLPNDRTMRCPGWSAKETT